MDTLTIGDMPHGFMPLWEKGTPTLACSECGRWYDDDLHREGEVMVLSV